MNDTYKIRSIGGALLVTIPQRIVRQMQLKAGDEVRIAMTVERIITVRPAKPTSGRKLK